MASCIRFCQHGILNIHQIHAARGLQWHRDSCRCRFYLQDSNVASPGCAALPAVFKGWAGFGWQLQSLNYHQDEGLKMFKGRFGRKCLGEYSNSLADCCATAPLQFATCAQMSLKERETTCDNYITSFGSRGRWTHLQKDLCITWVLSSMATAYSRKGCKRSCLGPPTAIYSTSIPLSKLRAPPKWGDILYRQHRHDECQLYLRRHMQLSFGRPV